MRTTRYTRVLLGVLTALVASGLDTSSVEAQVAEVQAAVRGTLTAWSDGDYATFVDHYHDGVRGFFFDGGPLMAGFDQVMLEAARDAGFDADIQIRDLDVRVHERTATSAAYLEGTLTLPGGAVLEGTWRYTETRVQVGNTWKVVQFHFSEQQTPGP